jgi:4-oxalomesaconate tautomerase
MNSVPFYQIRGGSSKGIYFKKCDLPSEPSERDALIIRLIEGSELGDIKQLDGLGGANSLTSKVAIVSISENSDTDLDYFFIQVVVGKAQVSTSQTCGNILAGVVPFAIETGMIKPGKDITKAKVKLLNTGGVCELTVKTPSGIIETKGETKIDGVVGTSAPIVCNYLDTVGGSCGSLLPSSRYIDKIQEYSCTLIDNGMPVVLLNAEDFGLNGNEPILELNDNKDLKDKIESIRIEAGVLMNLGDVRQKTVPKMCLLSKPNFGGLINTRMFIPHTVHSSIGVLAAVSVATACLIPDSICNQIVQNDFDSTEELNLSIEHPSGQMSVLLKGDFSTNTIKIESSGVLRTAKIICKGEVFIY